MKRKIKRILLLGISVMVMASTMPSCKGKVNDTDIKTAVETTLKANPGLQSITVDVKDGVATLHGEAKDESAKAAAETDIKEIKGLKSVVNDITIAPAPAPVVTAPVIAADDSLAKNIVDAIKDHPGVKANVKDGVVTLTGQVKKTDLPKLMQKINALHPAKVENKLTVK